MATKLAERADGSAAAETPFHYTICPVLAASNLAVLLGWAAEEYARVGARPIYLRSLPDNAGWLPHFDHGFPDLFRDGGAIPPIHAKAGGADTLLIGLTWQKGGVGGQVIVRAGDQIRRVVDLAGRRLGLYRSLNRAKVDFRRATAHRQLLLALEVNGLSARDVAWTDIDDAEAPVYRPARDPEAYVAQGRVLEAKHDAERVALAGGQVDAIYAAGPRAARLTASGEFAGIEDLSRRPDWRLHIANSPYATTVNRDFADRHPEVVVAWLRAAIRAGIWANANRAQAAELFSRVLTVGTAADLATTIADTDFRPSLAPDRIAALAEQKRFLLEYGYIERDFDLTDWAAPRFLDEALASL